MKIPSVTLMYGLMAPSYFDLDTWLVAMYDSRCQFSSGVVNPGFMTADVTHEQNMIEHFANGITIGKNFGVSFSK